MSQRRIVLSNAIYFVTTAAHDHEACFGPREFPKLIRKIQHTKEIHPFKLFAFMMLPNHIHLLLQPGRLETVSKIMLSFKRSSAFEIGMGPIWQSRFHDHIIRDKNDFEKHVNYIHTNPCKHNLVKNPKNWRWSSANPEFKNLLDGKI